MAAKQTSTLLGRFVEHQEYFHPLPMEDAQWAIQNPKEAAFLCVATIRGRANGTPKPERTYKLLRPVAPKSRAPRPFKAAETFFNPNSGVKMVPHGSNFTLWFAGYTEEDPPAEILVPLALTQRAYDSEIITDLGGEVRAEVVLSQLWAKMKRQANGEEGDLLTNGWANIFFVRVGGVLRAVDVFWDVGGWRANAHALDDDRWRYGSRVFSRNSGNPEPLAA